MPEASSSIFISNAMKIWECWWGDEVAVD